MTFSFNLSRSADAMNQLEKQLFRDVQKLIRYIDARKNISSHHDQIIIESYERMVQERCDALGNIARR
jgi:hypothetical protein